MLILFLSLCGSDNQYCFHCDSYANVTSVTYVEYFGKLESLEELCIKNIREIRESDLISFGNGWRKLRSLQFEVNVSHRYSTSNRVAVELWREQLVPCENLVELDLVNFIPFPGRGLACVLRECTNLEKLYLEMCIGVSDSDIIALVQKTKHLRSISLCVPSDFTLPSLCVLQLSMCLGITDDGFRPLVGSKKLELLVAEDCSQVSRRCVCGADKSFSWVYYDLIISCFICNNTTKSSIIVYLI